MTRKQDWTPRKTPGGMNAQPEWEFIANLGDQNPLDHGGYFIYEDKTGVYSEEAALIIPEENGRYTIYRFSLERYKMVEGQLVPVLYDPSWPRPLHDYDAWFHRHLEDMGDLSKADLEREFSSPDPLDRARAYRDLGEHQGFENMDNYPLSMTRAQVSRKYRKELRKSLAD